MKQEQHYQLDDGSQHGLAKASEYYENKQKVEEMFPGVPIVRGNTPRPLSFHTMISSTGQFDRAQQVDSEPLPAFPTQAPMAPPLPEESDGQDAVLASSEKVPISNAGLSDLVSISNQSAFISNSDDFMWLFEYGLEMDAAILNSPERLHGLALPYGPAVLHGYKIKFGAQYIRGSTGPTLVAIEPCLDQGAEVWGMLYSIPRRLAEPNGPEPSLLDTIHAAITPQNFFKGVQVVVHESQYDRDVTSLVYVATETAHQQLKLVSADQWMGDNSFSQRMTSIAHKQGLPEHSIHQYDTVPSTQVRPGASMTDAPVSPSPTPSSPSDEHNTEPLPAFGERMLLTKNSAQHAFVSRIDPSTNRWLIIFSLYLASLLLVSLTFAILQGMGGPGHKLMTGQFAPLGAPWLVLMYGLLGGCVSCIVTLGRFRANSTPVFIIISWFTRPFVGAILAILAYLLLTCGLFSFGGNTSSQHMPLFLLTGALAGFGESWIFFRRA